MKEEDWSRINTLMEEIDANLYMIRDRSNWAETSLEEIRKVLKKQDEGDYGVGGDKIDER